MYLWQFDDITPITDEFGGEDRYIQRSKQPNLVHFAMSDLVDAAGDKPAIAPQPSPCRSRSRTVMNMLVQRSPSKPASYETSVNAIAAIASTADAVDNNKTDPAMTGAVMARTDEATAATADIVMTDASAADVAHDEHTIETADVLAPTGPHDTTAASAATLGSTADGVDSNMPDAPATDTATAKPTTEVPIISAPDAAVTGTSTEGESTADAVAATTTELAMDGPTKAAATDGTTATNGATDGLTDDAAASSTSRTAPELHARLWRPIRMQPPPQQLPHVREYVKPPKHLPKRPLLTTRSVDDSMSWPRHYYKTVQDVFPPGVLGDLANRFELMDRSGSFCGLDAMGITTGGLTHVLGQILKKQFRHIPSRNVSNPGRNLQL